MPGGFFLYNESLIVKYNLINKKPHFSILKFFILYFMYLVRVCPNQLRKVTYCRTEFEGLNLQDSSN